MQCEWQVATWKKYSIMSHTGMLLCYFHVVFDFMFAKNPSSQWLLHHPGLSWETFLGRGQNLTMLNAPCFHLLVCNLLLGIFYSSKIQIKNPEVPVTTIFCITGKLLIDKSCIVYFISWRTNGANVPLKLPLPPRHRAYRLRFNFSLIRHSLGLAATLKAAAPCWKYSLWLFIRVGEPLFRILPVYYVP